MVVITTLLGPCFSPIQKGRSLTEALLTAASRSGGRFRVVPNSQSSRPSRERRRRKKRLMDNHFRKPSVSLTGKVAIITGAGAHGDGIGIGRASAILYADAGCNVACVDRDVSLASRTLEMIEAEGHKGRAIAIQADISDQSECARIIQETIQKFGRLDILLNCVGIEGARGTAVDVDMAEWRRSMETNVSSMVMMVKYAIPAMLKNHRNDNGVGCRGAIINMASIAGIVGGMPHLLYPTAKGAVVNLTRAMAAHHGSDGIRVNCICPGMVYTPMLYAGGMSDETRQARTQRSLLKTEGNGWDIGYAVKFLSGPEARWITGVVLVVDAGVTAAVGFAAPHSAQVDGQENDSG